MEIAGRACLTVCLCKQKDIVFRSDGDICVANFASVFFVLSGGVQNVIIHSSLCHHSFRLCHLLEWLEAANQGQVGSGREIHGFAP